MNHAASLAGAHNPAADYRGVPALADDKVRFSKERAGKWSMIAFVIGGIGLFAVILGCFAVSLQQALAAYLIGTVMMLGLCLGSMFLCMAFHLTNAQWASTIRRQFENVACMLPVPMAMFALFMMVELGSSLTGANGVLATWLTESLQHEPMFLHKKAWLAPHWVAARTVICFVVWFYLLSRVVWPSFRQDTTADVSLTASMRFHSTYGLLLFAFSTTLFSVDWLMALADFRFFSTMWGVYFFAINILGAVSAVSLVLILLRRAGLLVGAVTNEHNHDLGKLVFAFTVFWAYINYSQYFLIWYSNIPEETQFFIFRQREYPIATWLLVVAHFLIPWYVMLWREARRNSNILVFVCCYMLAMHLLDLYWIVRPVVDYSPGGSDTGGPVSVLLSVAGAVGAGGVFAGLLIRRLPKSPLVAINDPRLPFSLKHKNYV